MALPKPPPKKALFSYTLWGGWGLFSMVFVCLLFGYMLVSAYVDGAPGDAPALYFLGGFESLLLSLLASMLTRRVRRIIFYDDTVKITGWRTKIQVPYSEVTAVSRKRVLLFGYVVSFVINGQQRPCRIPENPKNKTLKTDLFSWLVAKIARPTVSDEGSPS